MKSLNKITKTRHKIHFNNSNSDNGGSDGGVTGRAAGFRRARRRTECMADDLLDPHSSLLFPFFLVSGGALASVSTNS
jgi:hypothetical protein